MIVPAPPADDLAACFYGLGEIILKGSRADRRAAVSAMTVLVAIIDGEPPHSALRLLRLVSDGSSQVQYALRPILAPAP
jgi:hypothetical protein